MEKEKLFTGFFPVGTKAWKEKIKADLKGADYEKKLVWHTDEGFDVQPFYRREDLKQLKYLQSVPGQYPFVRGNTCNGNKWKINQHVFVHSVEGAHAEALNAIKNGADSITFEIPENIRPDLQEQLLNDIDGETIEINFKVTNTIGFISTFLKLAKKRGWKADKIEGSLFCDPLSISAENKSIAHSNIEQVFKEVSTLPAFHAITVDAGIFHNSGASTVSEMAFGLAKGSAYIQYLTEKGYEAGQIAGKIRFSFAVGSNYFMEIAKFRALRFLWAKILTAYGVDKNSSGMVLHAVNSQWNKSLYDPYVNMLRTTTEVMSAILGGADIITTLPFDSVSGDNSEMGKRIARNQQLILKNESFFDKVADPAAGSYYIEMLTHKLIHQAWDLFLLTDEKGGFESASRQGFIQNRIISEATKKNRDVAMRKRSVLGINQFPNATGKMEKNISPELFFVPDSADNIQPYRAAAPFEALRYQTDRFAVKHQRPRVCLFPYGNIAKSRARAQFAANFFGCAGYEIIDHSTFNNIEEGIKTVQHDNSEIIVLCGADNEYADWVLPVYKAIRNKGVVVLAGYPENMVEKFKKAGLEHFIHTRCNMLEELKKYQRLLEINS